VLEEWFRLMGGDQDDPLSDRELIDGCEEHDLAHRARDGMDDQFLRGDSTGL